MTITWSETARADLRAIEAYIAQVSPRAARGVIQKIIARCERLARFPRSGPTVPDYVGMGLREVVEKPYRIIYSVRDQEVEIVTVIHAARRLPKSLI